jgi:uncharacterized protein YfaS (alpha-2-macroglobulin family)
MLNGTSRDTTVAERGTEVRFGWRAAPGDSVRVRLDVTDGTVHDAVRVPLAVGPVGSPRTHTVTGVVRDTTSVRVRVPADIDPARSRVTVRVGTTPLSILELGRSYLWYYPYACTEQLTSAGRLAASMLELARAGMDVKTSARDLEARLQSTVDAVQRRQGVSGAFGYWSPDAWSTPWLTEYAASFLLDARALGARVDDEVVARAARYLESALDSLPAPGVYGTRAERERALRSYYGQQLAAVELLRRAGRPSAQAEESLWSVRQTLAWEDRVRLASVLGTAGKSDRARTLVDEAWSAVASAGAMVDLPDSAWSAAGFPSRLRPAARLLRATLEVEPESPRLGALVERIVQRDRARRSSWFWNTQDYAFAASALAAFMRTTRATGEADVFVALGAPDATGVSGVRATPSAPRAISLHAPRHATDTTTVSLDGLVRVRGDSADVPLRLTTRGSPVFYTVSVEEVSSARPVTPSVGGLTVERWYEGFEDGRPLTEVAEGALVRVRLRVTLPADREYLAIEDLLPAGLEAVDLSLRTSSTLGPFQTPDAEQAAREGDRIAGGTPWNPWHGWFGSWDSGWWTPWEHRELHDDRVVWFARQLWKGTYVVSYVARATTAGRFVRPPAHAEEMYNPGVTGRSDGGWFVVRAAR